MSASPEDLRRKDALRGALEQWQSQGVPDNPGGACLWAAGQHFVSEFDHSGENYTAAKAPSMRISAGEASQNPERWFVGPDLNGILETMVGEGLLPRYSSPVIRAPE